MSASLSSLLVDGVCWWDDLPGKVWEPGGELARSGGVEGFWDVDAVILDAGCAVHWNG